MVKKLALFINTHTHAQIYDANLELVNLSMDDAEKPNHYSYGLHPWFINKDTFDEELKTLQVKIHEKRCLALGECGLDKLSSVDFQLQIDVFEKQIKIANQVKKPIIIHCVKAFNELINCLNLSDNQMPVIIHGFNNNENIARIMVEHGYYFSFGKALLNYESNAAKALKNVGRKNFFLETDDADLSIKYVYKKAAEILGIEEEFLKLQLQNNFEKVFKMKVS